MFTFEQIHLVLPVHLLRASSLSFSLLMGFQTTNWALINLGVGFLMLILAFFGACYRQLCAGPNGRRRHECMYYACANTSDSAQIFRNLTPLQLPILCFSQLSPKIFHGYITVLGSWCRVSTASLCCARQGSVANFVRRTRSARKHRFTRVFSIKA
jgi:hypothetical protein